MLRTNIRTFQDVIGQYHHDRGRYPRKLDELLTDGYLREIPIDPFTESRATWQPVYVGEGSVRGIVNVRPGPRPSGVEAWRMRMRHILR
jgi:general secretion pathway protein G